MVVEICAASVQSAINAQKGGADRIELCAELSVGGVTPSYGMIQEVIRLIQIPVFVLIRPRSGNFVYSETEFSEMKTDIEICKELGCSGIVSGVLNEDYSLDLKRTKELIELSKPLEFTFHRAFDRIENPEKALEELIEIGADRILTSGLELNAEQGIENLKRFKEIADNKIIIMPGSGINPDNAGLFRQHGFSEIHSSASSALTGNKNLLFNKNRLRIKDEENRFESDIEKIKKLKNI